MWSRLITKSQACQACLNHHEPEPPSFSYCWQVKPDTKDVMLRRSTVQVPSHITPVAGEDCGARIAQLAPVGPNAYSEHSPDPWKHRILWALHAELVRSPCFVWWVRPGKSTPPEGSHFSRSLEWWDADETHRTQWQRATHGFAAGFEGSLQDRLGDQAEACAWHGSRPGSLHWSVTVLESWQILTDLSKL